MICNDLPPLGYDLLCCHSFGLVRRMICLSFIREERERLTEREREKSKKSKITPGLKPPHGNENIETL